MSTKSLIVAVLTVLATTRSGWSLHRDSAPQPVRVTSGAAHTLPDTRSWGRFLVFLSNQDLGETGSTGTQVFRYSHRDYLCRHHLDDPENFPITPTLQADCDANPVPDHWIIPVTTGSCAPANPVIGDVVTDQQTGAPISQLVVFDASGTCGGDDNGLVGNARQHRQIFSKNLVTGEQKPLTNFTDGDSVRPAINWTGKVVAFESTAMVNGFPSNGVKQVYVLDSAGRYWNFPKGASPLTQPILNRSGDTLAFQTKSAMLSDGHDTGVSQIFWINLDFSKNKSQPYELHQLTNGSADSTDAYIASGGKFIVFQSKAGNLNGETHAPSLGSSTQVFYGPTDYGLTNHTPAQDNPPLTQVTRDDVNGRCTDPAVVDPETGDPDNRDGARLTFACDGDPFQNGTTGKRAFVLDINPAPDVNKLYQIDRDGDTTGRVAGNIGVWFVAVSTTEDLSGTGICGSQIHVVDYFTGKYLAATQIGQQPVPPTAGDPNASCEDNHACTTDTCNPNKTCSHASIQGCTENCPSGMNSECSDNQVCTIDKCVHFQCEITPKADHTPCNDANACTQVDECLAGICTGENPKTCPAPTDQCHEQATCNPTTGACVSSVKVDGTPCSDGDLCTKNDVCTAGVCKPGAKVTCTALNQCYNKGTCDSATGLCSNPPKTAGTTCNDGDLCTQSDVCNAGVCAGTPTVCPAGSDACHVRTCDPTSGQCGDEHFNTCDDANPCTTDGVCDNSTGCPPPIQIPECTTTTTTTLATTTTTKTTTTSDSTSTTDDGNTSTTTTQQPTTSTTLVSANSCTGLLGLDAVLCRFDKERTPGGCAADSVPTGIQNRFSKARTLIERASNSTKPKVIKRLVKKAGKTLKSTQPFIDRAAKGAGGSVISSDCSTALKNFVGNTRIRLDSLSF